MRAFHGILKYLLAFQAIMVVSLGFSQETLKDQFDRIMEKSSTYEQYKVIRQTEIVGFWESIDDTLGIRAQEIQKLKTRVTQLQMNMDSLNAQLRETKTSLEESELVNESITFLGMEMNKSAYHVLAWGIIVVLGVLGVLAYGMFIKSNTTTSKVKKEFEQLRKEFEIQKDKARETQVRLKRELQTAVNTIDEMKRGGARR